MHQDHAHVRKRLDQFNGVSRLPGIDLQFEMKIMFFQQRKTAAEIRIVAEIRSRRALPHRLAVPIQHLAHTTQIGKLFLRLQCAFGVRIRKISIADNPVRKAVLVGDRLQPFGLIERAARTPHRGDMHRFGDALRLDVLHELFDRIVAANSEIVAKHPRDRRVGKPGHVLAQPDMMVRVDHRSAIRHSQSP